MDTQLVTVPAGEFKQKCLRLIDEVNASGVGMVITKRGKPVAQLVPLAPSQRLHTWPTELAKIGSITGDLVAPVTDPDEWAALRD